MAVERDGESHLKVPIGIAKYVTNCTLKTSLDHRPVYSQCSIRASTMHCSRQARGLPNPWSFRAFALDKVFKTWAWLPNCGKNGRLVPPEAEQSEVVVGH